MAADRRLATRDLLLESRPEVDERRIGLWGTSLAGGHALLLGATDRRLRAVVARVPMISGAQIGQGRALPEHQAAVERRYDEDERAQLRGSAPATVTIVTKDPDVPPLYRDPDVVDFYLRPYDSDVRRENKLTLRSSRNSRMYEPGVYIDKVSPTPLLMIVGSRDTMTPTDIALTAYERALEPKRLELIPDGHSRALPRGVRLSPRGGRRMVREACVLNGSLRVRMQTAVARLVPWAAPLLEPVPPRCDTVPSPGNAHKTVGRLLWWRRVREVTAMWSSPGRPSGRPSDAGHLRP
ncbi:acetylxylan esterase [Streptomyces pseudogriseolus]|uniref:alpha/beta hydrolase n=1 Tax=Streptomyces pseudogriseolus TaxID=36817 RepID=UPI00348E551E